MQFIPKLKEYLATHSLIYTVRGYRYSNDITTVAGLGSCSRKLLCQIYSPEDLQPYVAQSGFEDVASWWAKVVYFIPFREPKLLYEVRVNESE